MAGQQPEAPAIPGGGHDVWGADFGQVGWHQPAAASPSPAPAGPSGEATGPAEGSWRERAERAEAELEHAKAALAGDHEGIRLWMLDCGGLVAKHRARAEAAEAKLAALRALCHAPAFPGDPLERTLLVADEILAIIGDEEKPS